MGVGVGVEVGRGVRVGVGVVVGRLVGVGVAAGLGVAAPTGVGVGVGLAAGAGVAGLGAGARLGTTSPGSGGFEVTGSDDPGPTDSSATSICVAAASPGSSVTPATSPSRPPANRVVAMRIIPTKPSITVDASRSSWTRGTPGPSSAARRGSAASSRREPDTTSRLGAVGTRPSIEASPVEAGRTTPAGGAGATSASGDPRRGAAWERTRATARVTSTRAMARPMTAMSGVTETSRAGQVDRGSAGNLASRVRNTPRHGSCHLHLGGVGVSGEEPRTPSMRPNEANPVPSTTRGCGCRNEVEVARASTPRGSG